METNSGVTVGSRPSEKQLIADVVNGDTHLFRELIRPYQRQIYQIALRMVLNAADAEDIVQETLISAYRNLSRFRGEAKFSTWLTKIAINHSRGRLRSQRTRRFCSIDETTETEAGSISALEIAHKGLSPLDLAEQNELQSFVWQAMNRLEPLYRTVCVMQTYDGFSTESAAKALGITIPAAKARMYRARQMLHRDLKLLLLMEKESR